jgi:hypothetical protein
MNQLHRILRWAWSILVVMEMTAQPDRRVTRVTRDLRDLLDLRDQGPR